MVRPILSPIRGRSNIPTFRPSCLLAFRPFPPLILSVSSADGALPSVDSSPNTISLDLSLAQYSLRSNTVWPRIRQVRARYRTQANRKQWDYSYGNADMLGASIDVVCHWSSRIFDPRCPVLFLRFVDVATYRAPTLIAILTLGSLQSPRAGLGRAFSATFPSAHSPPSHRSF